MEEEPKELKRAAGVLEHTFPGPIPLLLEPGSQVLGMSTMPGCCATLIGMPHSIPPPARCR